MLFGNLILRGSVLAINSTLFARVFPKCRIQDEF